jgi:TatD DNase family protein
MIDSHCHLAGEEFEADLPAVVDRARAAGVTAALVIVAAGDRAEARRVARVHDVWPETRCSAGIHPHQASEFGQDAERGVAVVRAAATELGAVAIGEIGLDYHYDFSPRSLQQQVFRAQLRLARELQRPVIIHTREATDDTFAILREESPGVPVVFHCFTGSMDMARTALDIGAWLSFAGIVTFPRANELREVAKVVPADRFLVETDAPYLAPVPHRGQRNEPAYVARVVEMLAEIRGTTAAAVAAQTTDNFSKLFGG